MNRRNCFRSAACAVLMALGSTSLWAQAAVEVGPDVLVRQVSDEVLEAVKSDPALKGRDLNKVMALVDRVVMPHVNFRRMTSAAVGPNWRRATPEQQQQLQEEFKSMLVRTYAGALSQVSEQSIRMLPLRAAAQDTDVLVRTEIVGQAEPIQLDYRLEKTAASGAGWKIYNFNVMGIWIVETYRSQFAQEISARGIDGLIASLRSRNQGNASTKP